MSKSLLPLSLAVLPFAEPSPAEFELADPVPAPAPAPSPFLICVSHMRSGTRVKEYSLVARSRIASDRAECATEDASSVLTSAEIDAKVV